MRRSLGRTFVRNQLIVTKNQDSFLDRVLFQKPLDTIVPLAESLADSDIVNGFEELRDRSIMLGE